MSRLERAKMQFNAAVDDLTAAKKAIDEAPEDISDERFSALKATFDTATAECNRTKANLESEESIASTSVAFSKVDVKPADLPTKLGMDESQVEQYSLFKAIDAATTKDWSRAKFERECSEAISEQLGTNPRGFFVPLEVQSRRFSAGDGLSTSTYGSDLVATELHPDKFIEMLMADTVLGAAGVTTLAGLVGNVDIPRQNQGTTGYWVGEGNAPTASEIDTDLVQLVPNTVAAQAKITRRMMLQASRDVEQLTWNDIRQRIGLAIDLAGLHGTGADNQPLGLDGLGINTVTATLAAMTFPKIVDMETQVANDNALKGNLKYIGTPSLRGYLKQTEKFDGTNGVPIMPEDNSLNGYGFLATTQATNLFFGDWSQMLIGSWGVLDLLPNPYTNASSGGVILHAFQDVDIAVRHPEAFCMVNEAS